MALKCADLGHLAAPWAVHQKWVAGLEEELFMQGDHEKQLLMPISPLMDRSKGGITKSQVRRTPRPLMCCTGTGIIGRHRSVVTVSNNPAGRWVVAHQSAYLSPDESISASCITSQFW